MRYEIMPNNLDQLYAKVADLQKQVNEVMQEIEQLRAVVPESKKETDEPVIEQSAVSIEAQTSEEAQSVQEEEIEQIPIVGRSGVFDGIFMVADDGKKFQVPPNYVSKSMLVVGDRLEIVEVDETGSKYSFKQVKNVERKEVEGILTKKDNQWAVHTDQGIYYVVAAAVRFHKADVGDVVAVILPAEEAILPVEWAAFKEIRKQALREKFEPRAKQYAQQKQQQDESEIPQPSAEPEAPKELIKSRLSSPTPINKPAQGTVVDLPPTEAAPVAQAHVVGEVHVSSEDTAESQSGEVTLQDEDLWELR